mmetsp:Transcript_4120/g.11800  ORF Transcript_4120/g.11800 Transcript_4120/m.11800 type:complete len:267 (-) Transcript_4120:1126-1926(-)
MRAQSPCHARRRLICMPHIMAIPHKTAASYACCTSWPSHTTWPPCTHPVKHRMAQLLHWEAPAAGARTRPHARSAGRDARSRDMHPQRAGSAPLGETCPPSVKPWSSNKGLAAGETCPPNVKPSSSNKGLAAGETCPPSVKPAPQTKSETSPADWRRAGAHAAQAPMSCVCAVTGTSLSCVCGSPAASSPPQTPLRAGRPTARACRWTTRAQRRRRHTSASCAAPRPRRQACWGCGRRARAALHPTAHVCGRASLRRSGPALEAAH